MYFSVQQLPYGITLSTYGSIKLAVPRRIELLNSDRQSDILPLNYGTKYIFMMLSRNRYCSIPFMYRQYLIMLQQKLSRLVTSRHPHKRAYCPSGSEEPTNHGKCFGPCETRRSLNLSGLLKKRKHGYSLYSSRYSLLITLKESVVPFTRECDL